MDPATIQGKRIALWLTDASNESAVFAGVAAWNGSKLTLDLGTSTPFEIQPEWYERISTITNEEVRRILLDCDFYLRLSVGTLPASEDIAEFEKTGLKWPE